jgi:hypothetical protein
MDDDARKQSVKAYNFDGIAAKDMSRVPFFATLVLRNTGRHCAAKHKQEARGAEPTL